MPKKITCKITIIIADNFKIHTEKNNFTVVVNLQLLLYIRNGSDKI